MRYLCSAGVALGVSLGLLCPLQTGIGACSDFTISKHASDFECCTGCSKECYGYPRIEHTNSGAGNLQACVFLEDESNTEDHEVVGYFGEPQACDYYDYGESSDLTGIAALTDTDSVGIFRSVKWQGARCGTKWNDLWHSFDCR